jgi:molybdenum cofactor biosynthesis enzyme MoaA
MLTEDDIVEYELEISANCNAECPLCQRTQQAMPLNGNSEITLDQIKSIFSEYSQINGKIFKLCGVLGDPIINPECLEICQYLSDMDAQKIEISTNGGINTVDWWKKLAKIKNVIVSFAIDGYKNTNHIYRVNVKWEVLERNLRAFCNAGGTGAWVFIPFDHNDHEYENALAMAKELGLIFKRRTSGRNELGKKKHSIRKQKNQLYTKNIILSNSKVRPHADLSELKNVITAYENVDAPENKSLIKEAASTIKCKHMEIPELYIGSDLTLWPCCFLYAHSLNNKSTLRGDQPHDWNDLKKHTIAKILSNPVFGNITKMWDPEHEFHQSRCVKTCSKKAAYNNKIQTM